MERQRAGGLGVVGIAVILLFFALNWDTVAGRDAPDFTLDRAYGGRVDLSAYRGKSVLLMFWATSCGICRHELPLLDKLRAGVHGEPAPRPDQSDRPRRPDSPEL